jgi:UMF1 family MFS transporter
MDKRKSRRSIFGWMMFDWATQPYSTLLLTFIFAPYFAEIVTNKKINLGFSEQAAAADAQSLWGIFLAISGLLIAVCAPIFGVIADNSRSHIKFICYFSVCYFVGASGLWFATPDTLNVILILALFSLGLFGMELATILTNAFLPTLAPLEKLGRISGSGWAIGYVGGLVAIIIALLFFAENGNGVTILGRPPALGLNPDLREGTRAIGPLTAIWFAFFMIPFFLYVRSPPTKSPKPSIHLFTAIMMVLDTIQKLRENRSLFTYFVSSMFYRDALNGIYSFGGIYAYGVLGWSVTDIGVFGILALISGAIFSWVGGIADSKFGSKKVIQLSIFTLIATTFSIVMITPDSIFGITFSRNEILGTLSRSDWAFYFCGIILGAAGGIVQSASRTMLVFQADRSKITEAFGLYAFSGKATAFLAPLLVSLFTYVFQSQRIGVLPIIGLFVIGLILLTLVNEKGRGQA